MSETADIDPGYLQPGTMVGAYKIIDRAGEGGFGFLYRVERDGKTYALKLSRERLANLTDEDRAHNEERTDREILALKSLRHPNIVRVHSFERWPELEDGFPYLVMDFITGDQLYQWRVKTSPSLRRITEVLIKIATAANYMHGLGILHRDFKSENILVRSTDGEPIILDLGIARPKATYTVTRAQNTLGTITHYAPEYAAWSDSPEFYKGQPFEWKATTDLHSLGYIAYELYTGASPFPRGRTEQEQRNIIISTIPTAPSVRTDGRVPTSIDEIVLRLLEKEPENRFQTGREFADALQLALEKADATWDQPFDLPRRTGERRQIAATGVLSASRAGPKAGSGESPLLPLITSQDGPPPPSTPSADAEPPPPNPERPEPRPVVPGGFNPPTSIGVKKNFTGIGTPASRTDTAKQDEEQNRLTIPTAIRKQTDGLKSPAVRRPPVGLLVGGGLALAVLVFMFVAATASKTGAEPRKANLLAEVEKQQKAEAAAMAAAPPAPPPPEITTPIERAKALVDPTPPAPPPNALATLEPPSPQPIDPASRPAAGPHPRPNSNPSRKDADQIDAELARLGGRPTVPPPDQGGRADRRGPHAPSSKQSADPSWMRRSQRLPGTAVAATPTNTRGVPLGAHLKVKLLSNLDSRTIGNAPVEAMLATPYIQNDKVLLPARTMLYGRGMSAGERFVIEFTRMRLPDNSEVAFTGLALDETDAKAGLVASRRIEPTRQSGPGVGSQVAKGTANTVLGTVTGGLGKDLVRNAGSEVVNHQDAPTGGGGAAAILLDAPLVFTVFVSAAF